jgi:hypothetical protein
MRRLLILAALIVAGALVWRTTTHPDEVSSTRAVEEFRAQGGGAAKGPPPRPGVYTYALRGRECGGFGPICLPRELPSRARLTVTRQATRIVLALALSADHLEAETLEQRARGLYLTAQRTKISFVGVERDDRRRARPVTLALPRDLRVGRRWTQAFRIGTLPAERSSRVLRSERVSIAGRSFATWVIERTSTTRGGFAGTETVRTWYAPALGLDVRRRVQQRVTRPFRFSLDYEATLLTATPAT